MIVSLRGRLEDITEQTVVLDVQGVGYEVNVTGAVLRSLPPLGQELQIPTFLQIRDDAFVLYGFSSWEERKQVLLSFLIFLLRTLLRPFNNSN